MASGTKRHIMAMAVLAAAGPWLLAVQTPRPRPDVLLVSIDTLRADRVGAYGYEPAVTPTLDGLAAAGARFADAVAHVPLTYPSHVSLLTGRYASDFGIHVNGGPVLDRTATTLAERLSTAGYRTAAFVGTALLDGGLGIDQGFQTFDDDFAPPRRPAAEQISTSELQRPAGEVVDAAGRWLAGQSSPWFAWIHLYDPHRPYTPPASHARLAPGRPYDGEIAYADAMIGRLLARIDRARTLVVVTADHGESLGEHGEPDHGFFIYDATLKIPLVIAGPGVPPRVIPQQVRLVDVVPTVLSLTGLEAGEELDGVSLSPLLAGGGTGDAPPSIAESWYPRLHFGWSELRGVRVGEFLYVAAPRPELYDLRVDPGQRVNIAERKAPIAARLAGELARTTSFASAAAPPAPDPETVARLQALGYVGTFAPATTGKGDDPKDRVGDYVRYRGLLDEALGALTRGRASSAVPILKRLVALNVRAFEGHFYLGQAYAATGRSEEALGELEASLQLNPAATGPRIEMAKLFDGRGQRARAVEELKKVLAAEPKSSYAWYTLGVVYRNAGSLAEAFAAFREAAALNARDPRAAANLADAALAAGRLEVAREQFERLIALDYRVAPAHYNLGLLAERAGDRAEAARRFKAALTADPAFRPAREALARLQ